MNRLREIRCIVFDVGETLVDEGRLWADLAQRAGITPFTLSGVLGALIERGEDHTRLWDVLGVNRPEPRVGVSNETRREVPHVMSWRTKYPAVKGYQPMLCLANINSKNSVSIGVACCSLCRSAAPNR